MDTDKDDQAINADDVSISFSVEIKRADFNQLVRYVKSQIRKSQDVIDERSWLWPSGYDCAQRLINDPKNLIKNAENDHNAFDELRAAIAFLIDRSRPLPEPVRDWLVSYLRGNWIAPKPPDRRTMTQTGKEAFICGMVKSICANTELKPMRNDATENPVSACDVIAAAFAECQLKPETYPGIKGIWIKREPAWRDN